MRNNIIPNETFDAPDLDCEVDGIYPSCPDLQCECSLNIPDVAPQSKNCEGWACLPTYKGRCLDENDDIPF